MASLWFNLGIVLILLLRKMNSFIQTYGIQLIFFLVLGCFFRVVVSIEFPFVKVISSDKIYPWILAKLNSSLKFMHYSFSLLELLISISLSVSLFLFVLQTLKYLQFRKNTEYSSPSNTEKDIYSKTLNELCVHNPPILLKTSTIKIPCVIGFFYPVVLLPEKKFSESELLYIFKHELTHYINRDLWIKLLSNYICNLFWWNPLVYFLKKDIGQVLEIKCDMSVCSKLSKSEKIEYFAIILRLIKNVSKTKRMSYYTSALVTGSRAEKYTKQRFDIMLGYNPKQRNQKSIFISLILMLILLLSYSFIVQPHYLPSDEYAPFYNSKNSIILIDGGEYKLYVDGIFRFVINETELESFRLQGIPINK